MDKENTKTKKQATAVSPEVTERLLEYREACERLADAFCEKHEFPGYDDQDVYFVDEFCSTLMVGDYAFPMQSVIEDLTDGIEEEILLEWYDYMLDYYDVFGNSDGCPNLRSYAMGCPRPDLARLKQLKRDFEAACAEEQEKAKAIPDGGADGNTTDSPY